MNHTTQIQSMHTMTSNQEVLNAVTMVIPTTVIIYDVITKIVEPHTYLLLFGVLMHLPISVFYHLSIAYGKYEHKIDNTLRRLDQSMQHVNIVIFSYIFSKSVKFTLPNMIVNMYYIYALWHPKTSNDGKRWIPIAICSNISLLPILWSSRNAYNYLMAVVSFAVAGLSYVYHLHGYGHCIFHILLGFFTKAILNALHVNLV